MIQFGRLPYAMVAGGLFGRIRGNAAKVYAIIAAHADHDWRSRPGVRTIARLAGIPVGSVSRAVGELIAAGAIRASGGGGGRYVYTVITSPGGEKVPSDDTFSDCEPPKTVHTGANGSGRKRSSAQAQTVHTGANGSGPNRSHRRERFHPKPFTLARTVSSQTVHTGANGSGPNRSHWRAATVHTGANGPFTPARTEQIKNRERTETPSSSSTGAALPKGVGATRNRDDDDDEFASLFKILRAVGIWRKIARDLAARLAAAKTTPAGILRRVLDVTGRAVRNPVAMLAADLANDPPPPEVELKPSEIIQAIRDGLIVGYAGVARDELRVELHAMHRGGRELPAGLYTQEGTLLAKWADFDAGLIDAATDGRAWRRLLGIQKAEKSPR